MRIPLGPSAHGETEPRETALRFLKQWKYNGEEEPKRRVSGILDSPFLDEENREYYRITKYYIECFMEAGCPYPTIITTSY